MFQKSSFHVVLAVCCLYLMNKFNTVASRAVLQSTLLDKYEYTATDLDCEKYNNDLEILAEFPFPVKLNPSQDEFYFNQKSVAQTSEDGMIIQRLAIKNEKVVPSSLFCLSNVTILQIESTPFEHDIIPDAFANLKALKYLIIHFVPIRKVTERFGTLTNLEVVTFMHCSLTELPKSVNQLHNLKILNLPFNSLTTIDEFAESNLEILDLTGNNITEVPVLKNKERLTNLNLGLNNLKNIEALVSYPSLQWITLSHAGLTSLPASIGKLHDVVQLVLNDNQLTDLPAGIFHLPKLQFLAVDNNQFTDEYIESIKKGFEKCYPTGFLLI